MSLDTNDTLIAPTVVLIANLPDSNKPKEIRLENYPKPITVAVRTSTTESFIDPVTQLTIPPDAQGQSFFTNLSTEQGLPQETVNGMIEDSKGNLWFCTGPGACRYDGKNFSLFSVAHGMSSNSVNCGMEDKDGNLWFGTFAGGASKYDGKTFTNYSTNEGLAYNYVSSIFQDTKGLIWFSTMGGGISCFDGKKFTNYTTRNGLPSDETFFITEDRKGDIWIATNGAGASRFDGKKFINYTTADGLGHNNVFHIFEDRSGQLWFSTVGGGASRFDGKKFTNYTTEDGLPHNIVLNVREDKVGYFWFSTAGGGISRFDGKSFTNLNSKNGLANDIVLNSTEDKAGNIWFGTFGGASCYKGKSFTNFTSTEGRLMDGIFSILKDKKGNLWFGSTEGGFICYTGMGFTNYNTGSNHATVYDFHEDSEGNIWLGTDRGLSRFDGKNITRYSNEQGLPAIVNRIIQDDSGNLWIGMNSGGASAFDGKGFTNYTTVQGLVNDLVKTITKDRKGNLWFGTAGGLSKYDGKSFTNYTMKQGLPNNFVININEDSEGNLWIGTEGGGLSRYDGKSFINFTTSSGLPDDVVTSVVIDSIDIVIGTNFGFGILSSFKPGPTINSSVKTISPQNNLSNEELRKFIPQIEIYNSLTGYPVKDINYGQEAMVRDEKGILWAGTGSDNTGLVRFDQSALRKSSTPPSIVLQKIKINNENICWNNLLKAPIDSGSIMPNIPEEALIMGRRLSEEERDSMRMKFGDIKFDSISRFYPIPINLVLPYKHNNISFDFIAIELVRPSLIKYQYFLDGYDKDWNQVTQQSSANYGNMEEGSYTFKLRAQSPEGVWSEPLLYKFRVLPPWWRTWWAYAGMVIIGVSAIWLFVRWRIQAVRKEKIVLEEKVELRTRELKSTQQELIQREKMASLGELTAGIAHEIQNPLNFVNNFSEVNKELIDELNEQLAAGNMQEAKEISQTLRENEDKINSHGKRADSIVKNMLQHSRSSAGKKELTDVNALAEEYLRLAFHGLRAKDKSFNSKFETDFDPGLEKINIVPQDIGRVLLNLVNNAFYAVMERKKHAEAGYDPAVTIRTRKTTPGIEICVKDNGNGIPKAVLDKIFQPFFTTKPTGQGTGLGLSLSYDIVKAHGGELKVNTEEGKGTEFTIIFPQ